MNEVIEHANRYAGGRALIVLGGPSGSRWESVRDEVRPDVIIGANGTCYKIDGLDYWLLAENLSRSFGIVQSGNDTTGRHAAFVKLLTHPHNSRVKMVNHRNFVHMNALGVSTDGIIPIRRRNDHDLDDLLHVHGFDLRRYGTGFINGWIMRQPGVGTPVRVGTVALQCMHLAAILGVDEIHTIGFDLMSRSPKRDHWYKHPKYYVGHFRSRAAFVEHDYDGKTVSTQWFWIETAQYMRDVFIPLLEHTPSLATLGGTGHIDWRDHSKGLLMYEKLKCTQNSIVEL